MARGRPRMIPIRPIVAPARRAMRRVCDGPLALVGRAHHRAEIASLSDAPWVSGDAMDRLRLRLLNQSIQRASLYSPFYREVLGSHTQKFHELTDLAYLPVTSRRDIRNAGVDRAIPGSRLSPRKTWRTSGSSGEPLRFAIDLLYPIRHEAQRAFVYLHAGLTPGSRIVEMLPGTRHTENSDFSYPTFNRTIIGYRHEGLGEAVFTSRPALLYGNRSHLLQVADELESAGRHVHVPLVCSSSETLLPTDAERLATAFGGRVIDIYGLAEGGNIAFRLSGEAPWTILEPRILVEVLDEQRRPVRHGEIGEIVITTLTEPTSPLIRYATGDLARVESGSAAGTSGLRLAALEGRSCDALVDVRGKRVSFWAVASPRFWASRDIARHVGRWRVHQSADHALAVYLEGRPGGALPAVVSAVTHHLQSMLGPIPVRVIGTDRVQQGTGKFRAVTSDARPGPIGLKA